MPSKIVAFELGGREVEVMVQPLTTLQAVLRYQLGRTAATSTRIVLVLNTGT